jgi:hypothetical protein
VQVAGVRYHVPVQAQCDVLVASATPGVHAPLTHKPLLESTAVVPEIVFRVRRLHVDHLHVRPVHDLVPQYDLVECLQ